MKLHVPHIIKEFSLFVANTPHISIKYLFISSSFSINIKTTAVLITITGVPSVLWGLLLLRQGQRYGGHSLRTVLLDGDGAEQRRSEDQRVEKTGYSSEWLTLRIKDSERGGWF